MNGRRYVEQGGGLLVPAHAVAARAEESTGAADAAAVALVDERRRGRDARPVPVPARRGDGPVSAEELADRLEARRAVVDVERDDEQERRRADAQHRRALADVAEQVSADERARRERARDAQEAAQLAQLYRRAARSGERARIRADIDRSAEMRALRVAGVRRGALTVGLPVLTGFAAWSTTGVQAGMVRLLHLAAYGPGWWAAWIVEPLLIAIVAGLIIVRAVLRSSGGDTDRRADVAEWAALGMSVALNMLGGWTGHGGKLAAVGEALGHSVGAVGAAGTAWLIGVVIDYASKATPWRDAPRLADLSVLPGSAAAPPMAPPTPPMAVNLGERLTPAAGLPSGSAAAAVLPQADRRLLEDTCTAIDDGALPVGPSGWAIYRRVMGGQGDRRRAYRVAELVAGWRPGQPLPVADGERVNGHRLAVAR